MGWQICSYWYALSDLLRQKDVVVVVAVVVIVVVAVAVAVVVVVVCVVCRCCFCCHLYLALLRHRLVLSRCPPVTVKFSTISSMPNSTSTLPSSRLACHLPFRGLPSPSIPPLYRNAHATTNEPKNRRPGAADEHVYRRRTKPALNISQPARRGRMTSSCRTSAPGNHCFL